MVKDEIIKRLSALGFPLFDMEEPQNINATIVDVVKSKDFRLWEGFPIILKNSEGKGLFNYNELKNYFKNKVDKSSLDSLIVISLALYRNLSLKFSWVDKLYKSLPSDKKTKIDDFLKKIKNNEDFEVTNRVMSSVRLKATFNNYFSQAQSKLNDLLSVKEQFNLEYAMSQIFSPKQKELFLKKLNREKLTKTEKEYFSRAVKKKILALANQELHNLSRKLLEE